MSKRHFILIAQTIEALRFPVAPEANRAIVAYQFAKRLALTNPRFKARVFLQACGLETLEVINFTSQLAKLTPAA